MESQNTDTPGVTLIAIQLTGTENYALWSRYMKIALLGKNKLGFVDGSCVRSSYSGALLKRWERCNAIVLSWIMNVVSKELMTGIAYASDSRRVWENLKEKFDKENSVRTFHLHKEIAFLTQGSNSVSSYFSRLSDLWDEFDALIPPPTCNCEISRTFTEHIQKHRVFQFLTGLNDSYSRAKSQILMMQPLPSLNQIYALVMQEESQRLLTNLMPDLELNETSAMIAKQTPTYRPKRSDLYCDYCKKTGHTRSVCRRLLGQSTDRGYQNNRSYQHDQGNYQQARNSQDNNHKMKQQYHPRSAVNSAIEDPKYAPPEQAAIAPIFSPEQYYQIQQMIKQGQDSDATANIATTNLVSQSTTAGSNSGSLQWQGVGDW